MNHFVYAMPPGRLTIVASDRGIARIAFGDIPVDTPRRPSALTNTAATQLQEYFAGKRTAFDVPVDLQGTPFQLEVWNALRSIPYGQTLTYADIAEAIGKPRAFRAVGMANNKNPVPIIVPCHRVIGTGGKLMGYAAGPKIKRYLLELEGVDPSSLH
ncbi:MAG: methylated-DNA--[protein]-cysteine S-methyltransferase [Slackia faecicanis]|nr:methylated-DNA--[protein]-cysteine S-methyltransferase [Slackia faecicanis]